MKNSHKKAKSFVVIMVVISILAVLLRIAAEKIIETTCVQNESVAQANLKLISIALENYAKNNRGIYPDNISVLTKTQPQYLDKDYVKRSPLKGYIYNCSRLDANGYNCYAFPTKCRLNGKTTFTVTTGKLLVSEECDRKE
ncbi:MAG: type II secretion system protein [Candidatus Omnitrophica bacterium]|nr:type II secretion system protein [Candidatus Omnitrophota bacterium]